MVSEKRLKFPQHTVLILVLVVVFVSARPQKFRQRLVFIRSCLWTDVRLEIFYGNFERDMNYSVEIDNFVIIYV